MTHQEFHHRFCRAVCGLVFAIFLLMTGCAGGQKNEVVVMGMIHGGHRTSERYSIERVQQFVRDIDPDFILVEIPPDRLQAALDEYAASGVITEPRVKVFPEYVEAIIPLREEMKFEIIPCAGWTRAMADDRREKLGRWKTERVEDTREMDAAEVRADERIKAGGAEDDPRWIHSDAYDAIVKEGLEPYNRLFNDDLGLGGWDNINAAHYALIAAALDAHRGEGLRVLITFGSWHKYWILEQLGEREDIRLLPLGEFMGERGSHEP